MKINNEKIKLEKKKQRREMKEKLIKTFEDLKKIKLEKENKQKIYISMTAIK